MNHLKFVTRFLAVLGLLACSLLAQLPHRDSYSVPTLSGGTGVGDLNGDGFDDVAFTSYNGEIRFYSGGDGTLLYFKGVTPYSTYTSIASGYDLTGDGVQDYVLGFPVRGHSGTSQEGKLEVYSGATHTLVASVFGEFRSGLGRQVTMLGDLTGDGISEIGALGNFPGGADPDGNWTPGGRGSIYDGASLVRLGSVHPPLGKPIKMFVSPDMTGDGVADIVLHSERHFLGPGEDHTLRIAVYSGATLALHGEKFIESTEVWNTGRIAVAGDVNGDGFGDLVVGSPLVLGGKVDVLSGFDFSVIHSIAGHPSATEFGKTVHGNVDVNADGTPDFVAASPFLAGAVAVFSGVDASVISLIVGKAPSGTTPGEALGEFIGSCGDLNGDGFPEIFVSDRGTNPDQMNSYTFGGDYVYGDSGLAIQSLDLGWAKGLADPAAGVLTCKNGIPGSIGFVAVSFNSASTFSGVFPVFVDLSPAQLDSVGNFGFDVHGELNAPVNLRSPFVAGTSFYVQMYSISPVFAASNGLQLLAVN